MEWLAIVPFMTPIATYIGTIYILQQFLSVFKLCGVHLGSNHTRVRHTFVHCSSRG